MKLRAGRYANGWFAQFGGLLLTYRPPLSFSRVRMLKPEAIARLNKQSLRAARAK
jgi:hypothetical protein